MSRGLEQNIGVAKFNLVNLVYWMLTTLIIYLSSLYIGVGQLFADLLTAVILNPISPFISYWLLGHVAAQLIILIDDFNKLKKRITLLLASIILAITYCYLLPVVSLLLVRLFTVHQLEWGQIFISPLEQPQIALASSILYILFFSLLYYLGKYRKLVMQSKRSNELVNELGEAQLKNLKTQMRPHFLFNALNTISMMVRDERKSEATEMISNLSDMLRASLKDNDKEFSTVLEEIDVVEKLLSIEKYRFEDRLTVELTISEEAKQCIIPVLIFQPLVENAFKHGVSKTMGKALVSINCFVKNKQLILEVFNSGPRLPENWELQKNQNIGLANTSSRLARIYGSSSKLIIEEKNDGILISIKLPVKNE